MENQLKNDFEKIVKTSGFSKKDIDIKKIYLNEFIKKGFPNKKLENWKFSDISQIIKKNIGDLDFYIDYSFPNKIDSSIFVNWLEHNKIVFINGRIEKIEFNYEDENKIEILDEVELKHKPNFENSLIDLNNAFTNKYYKIVVKEDYALKKPLIIYHTTKESLHLKNINLRLDFLLKKNSSLRLIDVLISWWRFSFKEKIPFIKADEYFPFKLQLISFFMKFEPHDNTNVSETLFISWSILLNEYLILLLLFWSIL